MPASRQWPRLPPGLYMEGPALRLPGKFPCVGVLALSSGVGWGGDVPWISVLDHMNAAIDSECLTAALFVLSRFPSPILSLLSWPSWD